jgi:hypothetical protein
MVDGRLGALAVVRATRDQALAVRDLRDDLATWMIQRGIQQWRPGEFVGTEVHGNRTQVCVLDSKGKELRNRNVVNSRRVLAKELSRVPSTSCATCWPGSQSRR